MFWGLWFLGLRALGFWLSRDYFAFVGGDLVRGALTMWFGLLLVRFAYVHESWFWLSIFCV